MLWQSMITYPRTCHTLMPTLPYAHYSNCQHTKETWYVWRLVHRVAAEQEGAAAGLVTREVVERVIGCIREQDKNMDCFDNEEVCKLYRGCISVRKQPSGT